MVLELAGGVRRAGKTVAHGFGGEAGDSERCAAGIFAADLPR